MSHESVVQNDNYIVRLSLYIGIFLFISCLTFQRATLCCFKKACQIKAPEFNGEKRFKE